MQVEDLEKRVNNGTMSDQMSKREARARLNQILNRELEEKMIFFKEWWVGKVDCPTPRFFKMLKVKH